MFKLDTSRLFWATLVGLLAFFLSPLTDDTERLPRAPVQTSISVTFKPIQFGCVTAGDLAISFDSGPTTFTADLLKNLKTLTIPATFFVTASNAILRNATVNEAMLSNHIIGLQFPPAMDPNQMTDDQLIRRLRDDSAIIFSAIRKYPRFLRFQNGNYTDRVDRIAQSLGFLIVEWNIEVLDCSSTVSAADVGAAYRSQFGKVPAGTGKFISSHRDIFSIWGRMEALEAIKTEYSTFNYKPVSMTKCHGIPDTEAYRANNIDYRCFQVLCDANGNPIGDKPSAASTVSLNPAVPLLVAVAAAFFQLPLFYLFF